MTNLAEAVQAEIDDVMKPFGEWFRGEPAVCIPIEDVSIDAENKYVCITLSAFKRALMKSVLDSKETAP